MTIKENSKIVVIGGGTGLSVMLRGLKKYPVDITAIVTVADDGGSSGRLRNELAIPPPGDVRNVLAALSDAEPLIVDLFQHRFETSSELSGHSLGNLIIAALTAIKGDFVQAVKDMSRVLNIHGKVLPAANQSVVLHAEMTDGSVVSGESKIPMSGKEIKRVYLTPEVIKPLPDTIESLREADMIVLGPGSLYTSILPNLLVPEIGEEVCNSSAKKVYICNLMTQPGETIGFTASRHVEALYDHMGCAFIDTILVNNKAVPPELQQRYEQERALPVSFDVERLILMGMEVIQDEIISIKQELIRHNTEKVASILYSMLKGKADSIIVDF